MAAPKLPLHQNRFYSFLIPFFFSQSRDKTTAAAVMLKKKALPDLRPRLAMEDGYARLQAQLRPLAKSQSLPPHPQRHANRTATWLMTLLGEPSRSVLVCLGKQITNALLTAFFKLHLVSK